MLEGRRVWPKEGPRLDYLLIAKKQFNSISEPHAR